MPKKTKKANPKKDSKANGARSAGVERARYKLQLPVPADSKTIARASKEMAKLVRSEAALREERREAMADFKERQSSINDKMNEWADTVEKGTELADVEVVERLVVETNEVQVTRLDTGEIVERRTAEGSDRQEALFDPVDSKEDEKDDLEQDQAEIS